MRGFDEVFGFLGRGAHDDFKLNDPKAPIYRGTTPVNESGYLTDRLGEEAVAFVDRNKVKPFFLYLAFNAVHAFRVGTGPEVGGELAKEETTIAEGFKANGYRTGVFGKWHNGEDPDSPGFRAAFAEAFKDMANKKFEPGLVANAHGDDRIYDARDSSARWQKHLAGFARSLDQSSR